MSPIVGFFFLSTSLSFLSSCFIAKLLYIYSFLFIDYTQYADAAKDTELYYEVLSDVIGVDLQFYSQGTSFESRSYY